MKKLIVPICLLISITTFAQQQKGDLSIQFSGNYFSQRIEFSGSEIKTQVGNVYVKVGQFFTPNIELGVKPNVRIFTQPKESDSKKSELKANVGFGLYGTYSVLLPDGKMVPYAGAEINYIPFGKESTVNLGPYAGFKYFVKENINIDVNGNYSINLGSTYGQEGLSIHPLFMVNVGVGIIIGKVN